MSTITRTLKSASKTTRNNTRPDDITFKREKLKTLLITKFVKKFNCPKHEKLITAEVTSFIKKDKLTDSDLKIFEEKLKKILDEKEKLLTKYDYTSNDKNKKDDDLAREDDAADQSAMTNNFLKESKSKLGDMIDYETITNFELRKQLESERRPLTREKFDQFGDEWTAIEKYKNEIFKTQMKKEKQDDKNKKVNTRENLNEQVKTKEIYKSLEKECDMNHHKVLMKNVRILEIEEMKKQRELEEKKKLEKEIRDKQIQENKMIKTTEFVNSRNFDKKLLDEIERQNQIQREKEIQNKIQAKKNLQEMLRENDELKAKQKHEAIKERESDIKYMNDYTKLLDKHEKEREDYFKRCASRQNEFMKRMAETVIKEQDEKAKEDERKMLKYQEEKNKK